MNFADSSLTGIISAIISISGMIVSIILFSFRAGELKEQFERKIDRLEALIRTGDIENHHRIELEFSHLEDFKKLLAGKLNQGTQEGKKEIVDIIRKIDRIENFLENNNDNFTKYKSK